MQTPPEPQPLDLVWGCKDIARVIGQTERATYHLLENGRIPCRKIGGSWVASRRKLQEHFEEVAQ